LPGDDCGKYPLDRFPIIVPALQKHRAKIAKLFGLSHVRMYYVYLLRSNLSSLFIEETGAVV
jgi:hypothetical protein